MRAPHPQPGAQDAGHTPYTWHKALPSWPSSRVFLGVLLPLLGLSFEAGHTQGAWKAFPDLWDLQTACKDAPSSWLSPSRSPKSMSRPGRKQLPLSPLPLPPHHRSTCSRRVTPPSRPAAALEAKAGVLRLLPRRRVSVSAAEGVRGRGGLMGGNRGLLCVPSSCFQLHGCGGRTGQVNERNAWESGSRGWWGPQQIGELMLFLKWAHTGLGQEAPCGNSGLGLWVVLSEKLEIHLFM